MFKQINTVMPFWNFKMKMKAYKMKSGQRKRKHQNPF